MPLISLSAFLLVGQLVTVALAQNQCHERLAGQVCHRADEIRRSPECPRGGTSTGAQRPLNDPPTSEYANNCMCTSTYYSMVSACEICSGGQPVTWGRWTSNCRQFAKNGAGQDEWLAQFNYPDWAKLFYEDSEAFSVGRLEREGLLGEPAPSPQPNPSQPAPTTSPATGTTSRPPSQLITATTVTQTSSNSTAVETETTQSESSISEDGSTRRPQSGSSTSSIISQLPLSSGSPNNPSVPNPSDDPYGIGPSATRGAGNNALPGQANPNESDSGKSLNVGAIVGGVVGGLFLILLIAGFLYFFVLRRRRKRTPPSAAYMAQFGDGRVLSPRPFTPDPSAPIQLHSDANSLENARAESPTLPRSSGDMYAEYQPPNQPNAYSQDPFNPPENHAEMRENNNMSRQSTRRYTRTPTPLIGPRPR
ncbi:hypothetical protein BKA70DRAFT_1247165 [Coprinopsis sp. MPI-PUGE-AT-0042]|nr:hypothetical protein BKA70DRAFT_1247165 [Coprinopsis sp. MPI-PUGE-AT-0042]